jgi:hypothetical protein
MTQLPENKLGPTMQHSAAPSSNHSNDPNLPIADAENFLQRRVVAVVIQHINGTAHLVPVFIHPSLNAENHVKKIREEYHCALHKIRSSSWISLFTKSMIGTAQINQVQEVR